MGAAARILIVVDIVGVSACTIAEHKVRVNGGERYRYISVTLVLSAKCLDVPLNALVLGCFDAIMVTRVLYATYGAPAACSYSGIPCR